MSEELLLKDKKKLSELYKIIPELPGCYFMKDCDDNILYIGKSKNLKNRVKTYFSNHSILSPRISLMVRQIENVEFILTDTETEALTLESNLIKQHQPHFNVLLKDDKKYPYVCIKWSEKYPRIFITRRRRERSKGDKYYGPFVDSKLLRNTLNIIKKSFPLRQRMTPLYKDKTCLNYSINRCPGVCQEKISQQDYHSIVKRVEMIFQGRSDILIKILESQMKEHSDKLEYELAANTRDQISGLKRLSESQKMINSDSSIYRDIMGISSDNRTATIQIFQMRSGKLVGKLGYTAKIDDSRPEQILQRILEEHYSFVDINEIPSEILVPYDLPGGNLISEWLTDIKSSKVKVISPKRSEKAKLINFANKNAELELTRLNQNQEKVMEQLEDLTEILELNKVPRRIEGYDISHIQGTDTVASQVVFVDGIAAKQHYRKYKIKSEDIFIGHSDDYQALSEVIERRFRKWSKVKLTKTESGSFNPIKQGILGKQEYSDWPDLVLIDGGKGQLNAVIKTLIKLDLHNELNVISLAKKNEEVYAPGLDTHLETNYSQPALVLLRRIRDEAHRFAIDFHRNRRNFRMTKSHLNSINGIGPKRIKLLLGHFQSIESIRLASVNEISKAPGIGENAAIKIWKYFHED